MCIHILIKYQIFKGIELNETALETSGEVLSFLHLAYQGYILLIVARSRHGSFRRSFSDSVILQSFLTKKIAFSSVTPIKYDSSDMLWMASVRFENCMVVI